MGPISLLQRALRGRGSIRLWSVLVVGALALTSCADRAFEYVRDSERGTAFKVPSDWTVFDKQEFLGIPDGATSTSPDPIEWLVAIDGAPSPSVGHVLNNTELSTDFPQGLAFVVRLNPRIRDQVSFEYLRNMVFPVDALSQNPDNLQMLGYKDLLLDDGVRGIQLEYQFRESALEEALQAAQQQGAAPPPEGTPRPSGGNSTGLFLTSFVRVHQIALLDANTNRVYFIAVMCQADCYDRNSSAIQSIIDSWTVRPA
jgi:hypothetical protein